MYKIELVVNNKIRKKDLIRAQSREQAIRKMVEALKKKYERMIIYVADLNNYEITIYTARKINQQYYVTLINQFIISKELIEAIKDFDMPIREAIK